MRFNDIAKEFEVVYHLPSGVFEVAGCDAYGHWFHVVVTDIDPKENLNRRILSEQLGALRRVVRGRAACDDHNNVTPGRHQEREAA